MHAFTYNLNKLINKLTPTAVICSKVVISHAGIFVHSQVAKKHYSFICHHLFSRLKPW